MESKWLKANQLDSARKAILRGLKKKGEFWTRIFPYKPVTSKGTEFPMGGGKGSVDHYVFPIKPGRIIFEVDGIKDDAAIEVLNSAAEKLPIATKIVKRT